MSRIPITKPFFDKPELESVVSELKRAFERR